ncbi:MAG: 23S rRNA pseudouridine(1911/1915/1917) synthase RluD [Neisseriaceae bacterium]|nr:MAG: 23S rRNA pseudouridine(1911/1915/1917) synthase RluD [Neisseriaceae bacterium]
MNKLPSQNISDDNEIDADSLHYTNILNLTIPNQFAGERIDIALAQLLPQYSRSKLSSWIKKGIITVNNSPSISKHKLIGGEKVKIFCQEDQETSYFRAEKVDFDIVFEDEDLIVIDKPTNLVVHPAAGNWSGTLLNGLLFHDPKLSHIPRAGIVHRLDKDTTGLMVVAKNIITQTNLVKQLQTRQVKRIYRAIVNGIVPYDGKIETLIGRHPHQRTKMAVVPFGGKEAITHVKVLERFEHHSYIECSLETGRTHQIRVHMKEAKHPLVGDPTYGNILLPASPTIKEQIINLHRQALHAYQLSFIHPRTQKNITFKTKLPNDMQQLLAAMRTDYEISLLPDK